MAELVSLVPFSDILKLVISQVKKVKDFKPLFEKLVSRIKTLSPILRQIDSLAKKVNQGTTELKRLREMLVRAKKLILKCSSVGWANVKDKAKYSTRIKALNAEVEDFCQVDVPLITLRNGFLWLDRAGESPHRLEEGSSSISTGEDKDEQRVIWESLKEKSKGKQAMVDGQVALAFQESLNMKETPLRLDANNNISTREDKDEQRVIWESLKEKGKREGKEKNDEQIAKALQYDEERERHSASAIQESSRRLLRQREERKPSRASKEKISLREAEELRLAVQESILLYQQQIEAERRARELENDEQMAKGLLYNDES